MNSLRELYNAAVAKIVELDERRDEITRLRSQSAAAPHERDRLLSEVDPSDDAAIARISTLPARAEAMKRRADILEEELQRGDAALRPLGEALHGLIVKALEARVEPLVSRAVAAVAPFVDGADAEDVASRLPAVMSARSSARSILHPTMHSSFETALRVLVAKTNEHGLLDGAPEEPEAEAPARPAAKARRK